LEKPKVFTREATGLVREISALGSFGVAVTGVGVISIFLFYEYFMISTGDNPLLSIGLMAVPFLALAATWAMLAMTFPRSGGDYVFNSRALHPTIAVMGDFLLVMTLPGVLTFFIATDTSLMSDMLRVDGFLTGNAGLSSLGSSLGIPAIQFVIMTIAVVVTMFFLIGRTRIFVQTQAIVQILNIALFLILMGVLGATSNATYQAQFTNFFKMDYNSILSSASNSGFTTPTLLGVSLFGTSFLIFWLPGPQWAAHVGGETKRPQKTLLYSIVGAQLLMIVLFLIAGFVCFNTYGLSFSYAANYLAFGSNNPFPMSQANFLGLIVPVLADPILISVVFIIMMLGGYFIGAMAVMSVSRHVFAWSFDRLIPSKFSEVSERFKTPVWDAVLVAIIAEVYGILNIYGPGVFLYVSALGPVYSGIAWGISSLAGVFLPMKKELFEQAPSLVRKKIGNIPVISLISVFAFVTIMATLLLGQIIPTFQGGLAPGPVIWTFGIFFAGLPFYYLVKAYRRKHDGFDLSLVYKQIPPD
jgi:amino acid transporter